MACVSIHHLPPFLYISFIGNNQRVDLWALKILMSLLQALIIALAAYRPYETQRCYACTTLFLKDCQWQRQRLWNAPPSEWRNSSNQVFVHLLAFLLSDYVCTWVIDQNEGKGSIALQATLRYLVCFTFNFAVRYPVQSWGGFPQRCKQLEPSMPQSPRGKL